MRDCALDFVRQRLASLQGGFVTVKWFRRSTLEGIDNRPEIHLGDVVRILVRKDLQGVPRARGIVLLQRRKDIVAQHYVAAVIENVALHPSDSSQLGGRTDEIIPLDRASRFPVGIIN